MSNDYAIGEPLYKGQFSAFQNKTLEQKIQELADREEIRELISRYAHCVAHGVSVAHMFTDDGVYIVRYPSQSNQSPVDRRGQAPVERRGREQLDKNFAQLEGNAGLYLPMIHNYVIEISGNEATGICSNELRTADNGQSVIGSGYYEDRFRRENGRWRFTLRDMTFIHWVPLQRGWVTAGSPGKG